MFLFDNFYRFLQKRTELWWCLLLFACCVMQLSAKPVKEEQSGNVEQACDAFTGLIVDQLSRAIVLLFGEFHNNRALTAACILAISAQFPQFQHATLYLEGVTPGTLNKTIEKNTLLHGTLCENRICAGWENQLIARKTQFATDIYFQAKVVRQLYQLFYEKNNTDKWFDQFLASAQSQQSFNQIDFEHLAIQKNYFISSALYVIRESRRLGATYNQIFSDLFLQMKNQLGHYVGNNVTDYSLETMGYEKIIETYNFVRDKRLGAVMRKLLSRQEQAIVISGLWHVENMNHGGLNSADYMTLKMNEL